MRVSGTVAVCVLLSAVWAGAQTRNRAVSPAVGVTELSVLAAEERQPPNARDLATMRAGLRSRDGQTARVAVRALGRLERPDFIAEIVPSLRHPLPEIRAEAANAIGQAARGWVKARPEKPPPRTGLDAALAALLARLSVEADADVRAAIAETIGRLPYASADQVEKARDALLELMTRAQAPTDRLGVALGLEAVVRLHRSVSAPTREVLEALRALASVSTGLSPDGSRPDPARDARVRRLATEALIAAQSVDDDMMRRGAADPDAQTRRLAMRALASAFVGTPDVAAAALASGLADSSPIVRLEALKAGRGRVSCAAMLDAARGPELHIALTALDQLAACPTSDEAIALLERLAADSSEGEMPRRWHRRAHSLLALASAAPSRAATLLPPTLHSRVWQLRVYAVKAATVLEDRATLERLVKDGDENVNVREAAIRGLRQVAGQAALDPPGALRARVVAAAPPGGTEIAGLTVAGLRGLTAARARVTIGGLGAFEIALIASEAPLSVLRFVRLARSGFYDGLTFGVAPDLLVLGDGSGNAEAVGDTQFIGGEAGRWPHVRGAVGLSTRGRDAGDAQLFIDLVDNPRLDHASAVFAHVLNGMDVVDAILEGDIIEKIEIVERRP